MIVVLGDGVLEGRGDPPQMGHQQAHQGRRRPVDLAQQQGRHRQMQDPDRRLLATLPIGSPVGGVMRHPIRQPGVQPLEPLRLTQTGMLGKGQDPVEARGLPDRFDVPERRIEIRDLPPGPFGVQHFRPGEGIAVPMGQARVIDLEPAEVILAVPPALAGKTRGCNTMVRDRAKEIPQRDRRIETPNRVNPHPDPKPVYQDPPKIGQP